MTTLDSLAALPPLADAATSEGIATIDTVDADICQAAAHATRLAIARWRQGVDPSGMQVAAALRASAQERWFALALTRLDAWRASGGFGQDAQQTTHAQKADAQ
jgi:hypothetical protein